MLGSSPELAPLLVFCFSRSPFVFHQPAKWVFFCWGPTPARELTLPSKTQTLSVRPPMGSHNGKSSVELPKPTVPVQEKRIPHPTSRKRSKNKRWVSNGEKTGFQLQTDPDQNLSCPEQIDLLGSMLLGGSQPTPWLVSLLLFSGSFRILPSKSSSLLAGDQKTGSPCLLMATPKVITCYFQTLLGN